MFASLYVAILLCLFVCWFSVHLSFPPPLYTIAIKRLFPHANDDYVDKDENGDEDDDDDKDGNNHNHKDHKKTRKNKKKTNTFFCIGATIRTPHSCPHLLLWVIPPPYPRKKKLEKIIPLEDEDEVVSSMRNFYTIS